MNGLTRTVIVAAVVISVGTAALAIAQTGRHPSAKQIPTIVASQQATVPIAAESKPGTATAPTVVKPVPPATKKKAKTPTKQGSSSTSKPASKPAATADSPSQTDKHSDSSKREVITHKVRDDSDGSSDAHDGSEGSSSSSDERSPDEESTRD